MKLSNPVTNFIPLRFPQGDVTQFFGESKELYSKAICLPTGCLQGHNGWDIVRPHGTPIFCVETGKVVEVKDTPEGYGKQVRVLNEEWEWVYGHLSRVDVTLGQTLQAGQQLGLMGNTGFVVSGATPYWKDNPYAGTHLHFGRRKFERVGDALTPHNQSYSTGDIGNILDYGNGYFGSVPFFPEDFEGFIPPAKPKHTFKVDMEYGQFSEEIKALQDVLRYEELFPETQESTGWYFEVTRKAVLAFQKKYGLITPFQEFTYRGKYAYQKTRAKLNELYS